MAKKKRTLGCLFYIALVLLVLVVFLFNRERVQEVLEKTGFTRLFEKRNRRRRERRKNLLHLRRPRRNRRRSLSRSRRSLPQRRSPKKGNQPRRGLANPDCFLSR